MTMAGTSLSPLTMLAGEDLEAHRLVKLNGSTEFSVVYADAGDRAFGVTLVRADNADSISIEMMSVGSTLKVIAAGAITVNKVVYTANDGKVSDSVSGDPIGTLRKAGVSDEATELIPYGQSGGASDSDLVVFEDEFGYFTDGDFWILDANNGGGFAERDEHGGVIDIDTSDTTVVDNDETYVVSSNEVYKPAAGKRMVLKGRFKLDEANVNDANIVFGLVSDTIDLADLIVDDGQTLQDSGTLICITKSDGGVVWKGTVRDTALDEDTDVGAFSDGVWTELKIVVSSAAGATQLQVEFFIDGVPGGTKDFAVAQAVDMRLVFGVKAGGGNAERLLIDKIRIEFER